MKNPLKSLALGAGLLFTASTFSACNKGDDPKPGDGGGTTPVVTYPTSVSSDYAEIHRYSSSNSVDYIMLNGVDENGHKGTLTVTAPDGAYANSHMSITDADIMTDRSAEVAGPTPESSFSFDHPNTATQFVVDGAGMPNSSVKRITVTLRDNAMVVVGGNTTELDKFKADKAYLRQTLVKMFQQMNDDPATTNVIDPAYSHATWQPQ